MKKILLLITATTFAMSGNFFAVTDTSTTNVKNEKLCKVFDATAKKYQIKIQNDPVANKNLLIYKKRAEKLCKTTPKEENLRLSTIFKDMMTFFN
jgi:hypothetical protein